MMFASMISGWFAGEAEAFRAKGISAERIHSYGFAFKGKEVLIGGK